MEKTIILTNGGTLDVLEAAYKEGYKNKYPPVIAVGVIVFTLYIDKENNYENDDFHGQ